MLVLQRFSSDPKNTLKAYWPKIKGFLKFKLQRRIAAEFQPAVRAAVESDLESARPDLHSRDLLVDAADYLAFLAAVQEGRAGLGGSSKGKGFLNPLVLPLSQSVSHMSFLACSQRYLPILLHLYLCGSTHINYQATGHECISPSKARFHLEISVNPTRQSMDYSWQCTRRVSCLH